MSDDDDVIGSAEAAAILGGSQQVVRELYRNGHLQPAGRTPNRWFLWRRSDIERFAVIRRQLLNLAVEEDRLLNKKFQIEKRLAAIRKERRSLPLTIGGSFLTREANRNDH